MRVARFAGEDDPQFGVVGDEDGTPTIAVLKGDPLYAGFELTGQKVTLDDVRLLAPVIPRTLVQTAGAPIFQSVVSLNTMRSAASSAFRSSSREAKVGEPSSWWCFFSRLATSSPSPM